MPWFRTIRRPQEELKILKIRKNISDEDLQIQTMRVPKNYSIDENKDNFTPVSSFHYLSKGIHQCIFCDLDDQLGIIVYPREKDSRYIRWRDSSRTDPADSLFKKYLPRVEFDKRLEECRFIPFRESKVREEIRKRYETNLEEGYTGIGAQINWTEGVFRYKMEEIEDKIHSFLSLKVIPQYLTLSREL